MKVGNYLFSILLFIIFDLVLSAIASLLPSQARHAREQIGGVAVQAKAMSGCSASIKAFVTVLQKSSCSKTASTPQTIGTHSISKCEEVLKIILTDGNMRKIEKNIMLMSVFRWVCERVS